MSYNSPSNPAFAHPLRLYTLISWPLAFALCVPSSITSYHAAPGIGLIPLTASAVIGACTHFIARRKNKGRIALPVSNTGDNDDGEKEVPTLLNPFFLFLYDVVILLFLITVLLFIWLDGPWGRTMSMLAAYASVPLLFAFFAHVYLALLAIYLAIVHFAPRSIPATTKCPNCNTAIKAPGSAQAAMWKSSGARGGYTSLLGGIDEDAQQYHDEEIGARKNAGTPRPEDDDLARTSSGKGKAGDESSISP